MLSAVLKEKGYSLRLVFIPEWRPEFTEETDSWGAHTDMVTEQTVELLADFDLVGLSLMSNYVIRARLLTAAFKAIPGPKPTVVWGGIHPTVLPEKSLEHADYIFRGESEDAFPEFVQNFDTPSRYDSIMNLGFRKGNQVQLNPVRPLMIELDELPFPDYSLDDDFVYSFEDKSFMKLDDELFIHHLRKGYISGIRNKTAYQTITTRGCPHNCTYCCNNTLRDLYGPHHYVRRRSNDHIIAELKQICNRFPSIDEIGFSDDSFFAAPVKILQDFTAQYKKEIGLPFFCLGSPTTITLEKMKTLTDAGLFGIQMGIQTGSVETQKLYKRKITNTKVLAAAETIGRFQAKLIPPTYDIIIDNPYESVSDYFETFRLLLQLPRPHRIQIFSLVLFPETQLYQKARSDGLLSDSLSETPMKEYHHRQKTYANVVFALFSRNLPKPLLRLLTLKPVLTFMSITPMRYIIYIVYSMFSSVKNALLRNKMKAGRNL